MAVILDVILPVFGLVALGYAATFTRAFDAAAGRALSAFVFNFALPAALFRSMAATAPPDASTITFLLVYYVATAIMFVPAWLLAGGERARAVVLGFGCAYGNAVLLGTPLILRALGDAAAAPLFLLIAFHSPIFFTLVTVAIEVARGQGQSLATLPGRLASGLLQNVILVSVVAGLAFGASGAALPGPLDRTLAFLGAAAFPSALFAMGAALRGYRVLGALRPALAVVGAKLLLHPALVAALLLLLPDVPPVWYQTAVLVAAMPVGVNVYLFATRYQAGQAETATALMVSNLLAIPTLTVIMLLLLGSG